MKEIGCCSLLSVLKSKSNREDAIDIWEVGINSQNIRIAEQYTTLLSDLELDNLNKFKFFKDYSVYLVSHVAMRLLISEYTNTDPKKISYYYSKNGKPWISKDICFNLSHAHKKAIIGFHKKDIGVDIEYKKDLEDYNSIEDLVYIKEEKEYIKNGYRRERFYELWTKKEAIIKGIGIGFSKNVKDLSIGPRNQYHENNNIWQIAKVKSDSSYVAHIAYKNDNVINNINYSVWEFKK